VKKICDDLMSACFCFPFACIINLVVMSLALGNYGLSLQLSAIKTLMGTNYEDLYESLTINLAVMNLDLALKVEATAKLIEKSSTKEKKKKKNYYELWEHSNRTCLMIIKYIISKSIRQSITHTDSTRDFLVAVGKIDKVEKGTFMKLLTTTTYDGVNGVREHI
jgi:hypothetical protein